MSIRAAVDVGGTFTDVVVYDDDRNSTVVGKTPSTPTDLPNWTFDGFRGGLGTVMEYGASAPMRLNSFIERTRSAPWGIDGGQEALPNGVSVLTRDGERVGFPNGKVDGYQVVAGDRVVVQTGGGGGCGDPRPRRREAVLSDVRAGDVSAEAALADYGVVVEELAE